MDIKATLSENQSLYMDTEALSSRTKKTSELSSMAGLSCHFHCIIHRFHRNAKTGFSISCSTQPTQSNIKVVINGASKEIGRAAVVAVTKARGMEIAGAVDSHFVGEDIGNVGLSPLLQHIYQSLPFMLPCYES